MPRHVVNGEALAADTHLVAEVSDVLGHRHVLGVEDASKVEDIGIHARVLEHRTIIFVDVDRHPELRGISHMVDMAMGEHDRLHEEVVLARSIDNDLVGAVSRIHHCGGPAPLVVACCGLIHIDQHVAIGLEGARRKAQHLKGGGGRPCTGVLGVLHAPIVSENNFLRA